MALEWRCHDSSAINASVHPDDLSERVNQGDSEDPTDEA